MNKKKTLIIVLVLAVIASLAAVSYYFSRVNSANDKIKIGFIGSLTGLDPSYGIAMRTGVEMATEEINQRGGINGKKVEIVYEDGKCIDSASSVSAAQKLINVDKVKIIIGGGCSNEIISIIPIVDKAKVLVLSSGASSPNLSGASSYVFRNAPSDAYTGKALARYISNQGYKRVAVVSDQTDYSQGFRDSFLSEFKQLGGVIVADEEIEPNSSDNRSTITKLKALDFDALFVNPNTPKIAGLFVRQAGELGLRKPVFLAYHATPVYLETAGKFAEGTMVINTPLPDNPIAQKVLKYFEEKVGPVVYPYNTVAAYDAMNILAQGIEKFGLNTSELKTYLSGLDNYEGALGNYGFNPKGDISRIIYRLEKVVNGKFILMSSYE